MRLIDADELKKKKKHSKEFAENVVSVAEIDWQPTVGTVMDAKLIERIERYIPEIEDKVPDVASAVKGFIEMWKAEQEKKNDGQGME